MNSAGKKTRGGSSRSSTTSRGRSSNIKRSQEKQSLKRRSPSGSKESSKSKSNSRSKRASVQLAPPTPQMTTRSQKNKKNTKSPPLHRNGLLEEKNKKRGDQLYLSPSDEQSPRKSHSSSSEKRSPRNNQDHKATTSSSRKTQKQTTLGFAKTGGKNSPEKKVLSPEEKKENSYKKKAVKRKQDKILETNPTEYESEVKTKKMKKETDKCLPSNNGDQGNQEELIEIKVRDSTQGATKKKKVQGTKKKMNIEVDRSGSIKLYEIRAEFEYERYSVFRHIVLADTITFAKFARILVTATGKGGLSDWIFKINSNEIHCPPDDEDDRCPSILYGDSVKLDAHMKVGNKFEFISNPKNPWVYKISVKKSQIMDLSKFDREDPFSAGISHAFVLLGNLRGPSSENESKEEYIKKLKADKDGSKLDIISVNNTLSIYLYDDTKLTPEMKEANQFFAW